MKKSQIIINTITWLLLGITTIVLTINWNQINSIVGIHKDLMGNIDYYSDKIFLVIFLIIAIVANIVLSFGYTMPYVKQFRFQGSKAKYMTSFFQLLFVVGISSFILVSAITH